MIILVATAFQDVTHPLAKAAMSELIAYTQTEILTIKDADLGTGNVHNLQRGAGIHSQLTEDLLGVGRQISALDYDEPGPLIGHLDISLNRLWDHR
jgi:hypothetical protein